jgi:hypothetical protein
MGCVLLLGAQTVAGAERAAVAASVSVDSVLEENLSGWNIYRAPGGRVPSEYISVATQTERLHGTDRGLLFTFHNIIARTHHGGTTNDIWQIANKRALTGPFLQMDRYTRFTAWVYVEGARHPHMGLILYFRDPDDPKRKIAVTARTVMAANQWTKLILTFDHLPAAVRQRCIYAGLFRFYMRPEPGDDRDAMRVYIDDFRLEHVAERKCRGTDADPTVVIVNQVGYRSTDRKQAVVNGSNPDTTFRLRRSDNNAVVLEGALDSRAFHVGAFKLADFGSYRTPGRYYTEAGGIRAVDFDINDDVYRGLTHTFAYGIRNMRCGSDTEQHPACHLDNAHRIDTGAHVDVVGGYHDAGDTRHYNRNSVLALNAAALAARAARAAGAVDTEFLTEARHAASHLERLIREFGPGTLPSHLENRSPGLPPGSNGRHCNYWTDNVPGNEDDHVVVGGEGMRLIFQNEYYHAAWGFALLADLVGAGTDEGRRCLKTAEELWRAQTDEPSEQFSTALACLAGIELHRVTGNEDYADRARELGSALLTMQELRVLKGSSPPVSGYFYDRPGNGLRHYQRMHHNNPAIRALAALCRAYPDAPGAARWRLSLLVYSTFYVKPLTRLERPYGTAITAMATQDESLAALAKGYPASAYVPLGTDAGGRLMFAGFEYQNSARQPLFILTRARTRLHLARALGDLDLQEAARRNLGFTLGENPFNAMAVSGIGQDPLYGYYCIYGPTRGGIVHGVGFDYYTRHSAGSGIKEIWVTPTCVALELAAELAEPFRLSGTMVSGGKPHPGEVSVRLPGDPGSARIVKADADGAFGPAKLSPGVEYELRAGPVVRRFPAVAGTALDLVLDVQGDVSLADSGATYAKVEVRRRRKPKTKPEVAEHAPGTLLAPIAGEPVVLKITVTPRGEPATGGRLRVSGINVSLPSPVVEYEVVGPEPFTVEIPFKAETAGNVFAIRAVVESQPDTALEWSGVAHAGPE